MRFVFPCDIVLDREELRETGRRAFNVKFPDVYGANTSGWSWEEAIEMAEDCLAVALGMYMKAGEDIPQPSPVAEGQVAIPVPPITAAKLSLYTVIRERGLSTDDLAGMLKIDNAAVNKLLHPGYRSHLTHPGIRSPRPRLFSGDRGRCKDSGRDLLAPPNSGPIPHNCRLKGSCNDYELHRRSGPAQGGPPVSDRARAVR